MTGLGTRVPGLGNAPARLAPAVFENE